MSGPRPPIASNRQRVRHADGKEESIPQTPTTLRLEVRASFVRVFGESTLKSGKYRIRIDGKKETDLHDMTSARFNGNWDSHQSSVTIHQ